jgi:hypothetical protein
MCHARFERVLLVGTRSADYIRASGHSGCIQRPYTWLHPTHSLKCQILPLQCGRRPYMAHRRHGIVRVYMSAIGGIVLQKSPRRFCGIRFWNKRIKLAAILNRYCVSVGDLESIFLAPRSKIVLQHNLPFASICTTKINIAIRLRCRFGRAGLAYHSREFRSTHQTSCVRTSTTATRPFSTSPMASLNVLASSAGSKIGPLAQAP